jgi:hypothetical protein
MGLVLFGKAGEPALWIHLLRDRWPLAYAAQVALGVKNFVRVHLGATSYPRSILWLRMRARWRVE